MAKQKWSPEDFKLAVKNSKNLTEIRRFLDLKSSASNNTIKNYINIYGLDITHFENRKDLYGRTLKPKVKKTPLSEILIEGSTFNRVHLKERLFKEGLKKEFVRCVVKVKFGLVKKFL